MFKRNLLHSDEVIYYLGWYRCSGGKTRGSFDSLFEQKFFLSGIFLILFFLPRWITVPWKKAASEWFDNISLALE